MTVLHLPLAVGLGAVVYGTVLAGLWCLANTPAGPDTDAPAALRRVLGGR